MTAKTDRLMVAIAKNTTERRNCEKKLKELRVKCDALIVQADEQGVPRTHLAGVAQMTRQTIYMILMRAKAVA